MADTHHKRSTTDSVGDSAEKVSGGQDGEHASKKARTAEVESHADVKELLQGTTLRDLLKAKERPSVVTTFMHNMPVGDGLKALSDSGILSAPVLVNASIEDRDFGTYMGMVDVSAVLEALIRDVDRKLQEQKEKHNEKDAVAARWTLFRELGESFLNRLLITVTHDDKASLCHVQENQGSLWDLIRNSFMHADTKAPHVHRVAIFNSVGRIKNIISQSDVIRFLASKVAFFGPLRHQTVEQLGFLSEVVCVPETLSTLETLRLMYSKKLTGVGIVDEAGKLVSNFSVSDLRGIVKEDFLRLEMPVRAFTRLAKLHQYRRTISEAVTTVSASTTLEELLDLFSKTGYHRLYSVSEDGKPNGVITLTDILALVVE